MTADIVVGLGYGDEGKGMLTSHLAVLAPAGRTLVVRYGGGNQVGHTVNLGGDLVHVHHHTGSGSLFGLPTYYSEYTTVDPIGTLEEIELLRTKHKVTDLVQYYHTKSMVVTPWDVFYNRKLEETNAHGSVGVGFGATITRNKANVHLYTIDLLSPLLKEKLNAIKDYYENLGFFPKVNMDLFIGYCRNFIGREEIKLSVSLEGTVRKKGFNHLIFEGHQGVLLDMEFGVFPHVTHSKTTPYNAIKLLNTFDKVDITLWQVMRGYLTRHGNGPFPELTAKLINTGGESNVFNEHQGEFRTSIWPRELFVMTHNYVSADLQELKHTNTSKRNIVITCLDQMQKQKPVIDMVLDNYERDNVFVSSSPDTRVRNIKLYEIPDFKPKPWC